MALNKGRRKESESDRSVFHGTLHRGQPGVGLPQRSANHCHQSYLDTLRGLLFQCLRPIASGYQWWPRRAPKPSSRCIGTAEEHL